MSIKKVLKQLQAIFPESLLFKLQDLHSKFLWQLILRGGSQPSVISQKSAIIFSPHQDDETFGCGGVIALKCQQNIPVTVVFITDGRGSLGEGDDTQDQLVKIRNLEALKALEILGVNASCIYFLNQPDGSLPDLGYESRQMLVDQLSEILKSYQPGEVYVPHKKDCHRDHEATYELVRAAIKQAEVKTELFQYPIWLLWRAPLFIMLKLRDLTNARSLSILDVQHKKQQAISTYRSQLGSLPNGFMNHFMGEHEIFFKEDL